MTSSFPGTGMPVWRMRHAPSGEGFAPLWERGRGIVEDGGQRNSDAKADDRFAPSGARGRGVVEDGGQRKSACVCNVEGDDTWVGQKKAGRT